MARWPAWVYGSGEEPDYRFSMANERTFLAWLRTALALLAAGVAVDTFDLSMPDWLQRSLAALLVLLGMLCAGGSWVRWASAERAIRHRQPIPAFHLGLIVAGAVVVAAAALLIVGL